MSKKRYEVRPDADRWVVWDTREDKVADECTWRFGVKGLAEQVAERINEGER